MYCRYLRGDNVVLISGVLKESTYECRLARFLPGFLIEPEEDLADINVRNVQEEHIVGNWRTPYFIQDYSNKII